jgi:hypothetical protein
MAGLVVGYGFSGHGFKLSPGVGRVLAQEALGLPTDVSLAPVCAGALPAGAAADRQIRRGRGVLTGPDPRIVRHACRRQRRPSRVPSLTGEDTEGLMLIRLLYVSRAVGPQTGTVTASILLKARANNARQDIGGVLLQGQGLYLQVLEGERDRVHRLYASIVADSRHQDVQMLHLEEITQRRFSRAGRWRMSTWMPATRWCR